ncbi:hypothetical protein IJF81_06660, partial [bacterium]|nr:hypothetical protein [bacterium]
YGKGKGIGWRVSPRKKIDTANLPEGGIQQGRKVDFSQLYDCSRHLRGGQHDMFKQFPTAKVQEIAHTPGP